ncbi:plasmid replication initiator TrfA [Candidatus Methylospira mobilis]|uniref:plasmid replication initiator TrfA n=1 Tax=Candidatus Methylospira mobilis TaxID=1808979 RepID=UPI0028E49765|nr:plasmid replication initiator TrfA [Candidatus Methylospira mobilis]WNV03229.1 plasmid replication initiator TrfA [Candidatus Methylospira mobilis]
MRRAIKAREEHEGKSQPAVQEVKNTVLQFPSPFGDDTRAVSNKIARCALFAAVKKRQFFRDYVTVGEVGGVKIEFCGEQLNQDDHDTLMQLIFSANHKPLGVDVCASVNAVLKGLGRDTYQEQRRQLFEQISRLVRGTIRLTLPNMPRYEGHLLDDASTPQDQAILPQYRRHLVYRLNPKFARFFGRMEVTLIDWQDRLKISGRGSELAKWLHLHIESHAEQYSMKAETIRDRSGSQTKELKHFRAILRQALDLLKDAGIITAWSIDAGDLVHIERIPSPAQIKHIEKKAKCRKPIK